MEKFGIFELLDALSALSDSNLSSPPAQSPATPEQAERPQPSEKQTQNANSAALENFLMRHDAIAKRADKHKP